MKGLKKLSLIIMLIGLIAVISACSNDSSSEGEATGDSSDELKGEITVWHSFTQGSRKDFMDNAAKEFMEKHEGVKINMESFAWAEFHTKWTTGFSSGQVPDVSTALPNHVVEMLDVDAIIPLNDVIDNIGRDRFHEASLDEGTVDGNNYSLPIYSHAMVMWYRKDLLDEVNMDVPETWDELYEAAVKITENTDTYGLSVPMGSNDMLATRFLNFYVRSAGETLITEDGKANLTSPEAIEGIKYWVKMFEKTSPEGSVNYNTLDQATLFYDGNTAFDFNSGFQIGGVEANSPELLDNIAAAPIPKVNKEDDDRGIETSNIPLVVWKNSKHPEIAKAFVESLYEEDKYIEFLHSVPAGMLPALKDINDDPRFLDNETIQKFEDAVDVISEALEKGKAIGMEHGPRVEAGILTNQGIIENMFQEIVLSGVSVEEAAKAAEEKLNEIFATY